MKGAYDMTLYNYLREIKKLPEVEAMMIRTAYIFRCNMTDEQKEMIKEYEKIERIGEYEK